MEYFDTTKTKQKIATKITVWLDVLDKIKRNMFGIEKKPRKTTQIYTHTLTHTDTDTCKHIKKITYRETDETKKAHKHMHINDRQRQRDAKAKQNKT